MITSKQIIALVALIIGAAPLGYAAVMTSGSGSAVVDAHRTANFDSIQTDDSLLGYTENALVISMDDLAYAGGSYAGTFYGSSGNYNWASIYAADGADFSALEMTIGGGWGSQTQNYLRWETLLDGEITGSGFTIIDNGGIYGWFEATGFDTLNLAVGNINPPVIEQTFTDFGDYQAIWIDDLSATVVPAPAAIWLFASAIGMLTWRRRSS